MRPKRFPFFLACLALIPALAPCAFRIEDGDQTTLRQSLSSVWAPFHDPHSLAAFPTKEGPWTEDGFESPRGLRMDYTMKTGATYPYAGFVANFAPRDWSSYEGVRFRAKGRGPWTFQLPTLATSKEYNHFTAPLVLTEQWKLFEIPFSRLTQTWGTQHPFDPTQVTGLQWSVSGPPESRGYLVLDDIECYQKEESTPVTVGSSDILPGPKVNQVGYLPSAEKHFVVSASSAKGGESFQVLDGSGAVVLKGRLPSQSLDDTPSTGEKVYQGDFSSLTKPGRYRVQAGAALSPIFRIAVDAYGPLYQDALRTFHLNRCGVALDDPVTGLKHAACHQGDASPKEAPQEKFDLTGGWHNAGDYGKWIHMEAISCAFMMWLWEIRGGAVTPARSDDPSLLDEARWGLEWMLKMQRKDGSVWHKVDPEQTFCFGTAPEKDPTPRHVAGCGSIDAAVFCGALCQASRVYRATDAAFSKRCLAAAQRAWAWLEKNPNVTQKDFAYTDADPSQEALWALCEMARTTGDPALRERVQNEATPGRLQMVSWMTPQFFGYLARWFDPSSDEVEKEALRGAFRSLCDPWVERSLANGYGTATLPSEYHWESNEALLDRAAVLLAASKITEDDRYRATALRQMDWLLGTNSLSLSFVTGHGEKAVQRPYHWAAAAYGIVIPGWVAGGPNQYPTGADPLLLDLIHRKTPPAKCFVDANSGGSWASNEGETTENAALVFTAGLLSEEGSAD